MMVLSESSSRPSNGHANLNSSGGDKKKRADGGSSSRDDGELLNDLFESCMAGDVEAISRLIDFKLPVDKSNERDVTALQVASAYGRDEVVKLLIMKGAALEKSNEKKWTPLMQAARQGHSNVVSTLLQNHADVNARTRAGANAMLLASRRGDLATCKLLAGAGIDPSSQQSGDPCNPACDLTPMMVASYCGHRDLVKYFLECGEDVDQRSPSLGVSCLVMAALGGHENVVRLLVEHGANPDKTDINNRTALDFAMMRNHRKIQAYLGKITTFKSKAAYEDAKLDIIEATKKGNFMRVREILDRDISQRDAAQPEDGATALMFAAVAGRLDIVQELVERGCNVDKQDEFGGWTALMQAVYHGRKAVAKYLLSAGADVQVAAKNGYTAFDMLTLLDDVDTELYRMLATATMGTPESSKSSTLKQGQQSESNLLSTFRSRSHSRQNLKDWWLKMSDRFRHLKWGNGSSSTGTTATTNNSNVINGNNNVVDSKGNNRVASSASTSNLSSSFVNLDRLRGILNGFSPSPGSARSHKKLHSTTLNVDTIASNGRSGMEKVSSISTINSLGAIKETESPVSVNSYEDDLDPLRDSLMYTVGNLGAKINSSLKSDLPVFLPPPTSHCQNSATMPVIGKNNHRRSTEARHQKQKKEGFLPSLNRKRRRSGADLVNGQLSPRTADATRVHSIARQQTTVSMATSSSVSPSASGGSDELKRGMPLTSLGHHGQHLAMLQCLERSKVNSSASSSTGTLTAGMDAHDRTLGELPRGKSKASSCANHLAPGHSNLPCSETSLEDLGSILQKLSLEKYRPIFEEQEVDMETFLLLTDSNLRELGISHTESRSTLLSAIDRINLSKK